MNDLDKMTSDRLAAARQALKSAREANLSGKSRMLVDAYHLSAMKALSPTDGQGRATDGKPDLH